MRASAKMCNGTGRLTAWLCLGNQAAADNGCGQAGPGFDIARARLDQMNSNVDHALWAVKSSADTYGAINECFN